MLVMQCFQVIYWGISHESVVFPLYTHGRLGEWACQENASDKWDIPWYITSKHCITVSYSGNCHVLWDDWVWYHWIALIMGRFGGIPTNIQHFSCILIGCIFWYKSIYKVLKIVMLQKISLLKDKPCKATCP